MQYDKKFWEKAQRKVRIYKYMAIAIIIAAVLCIAGGMIFGSKLVTFIGILLISVALTPLIEPLVKGF